MLVHGIGVPEAMESADEPECAEEFEDDEPEDTDLCVDELEAAHVGGGVQTVAGGWVAR